MLYDVLDAINRFMESGPPFLLGLLYIAVVTTPLVLLHELGHAAAAVRLLGADVTVSVGTAGKVAERQLGKVAVTINAFGDPRAASGAAVFDASRATARDVLLIALAGPAASLAGLVASAELLAIVGPGVVHDLLWTATLWGAFALLNLIPFELQQRRGAPKLASDGRLALSALRVLRQLR